MSLSAICIRRPVLAIVLNLIILLFGVLGFTFLGVREYPSIDPPIISVRTSYTGANADVVESQITEPLEKSINGIAGIRTISSGSSLGASNITVEFNLDIDLETAANDVHDKVSQALRQLPADIDAPPVVTKADANSDAILALTIQSDTKNRLELDDYAENVIAERLQTIPGVSTIQIWGQQRYAMRLWMDPAKLASYHLTPLDIQNALNDENLELPGGKIEGNATELTVRTIGKLTTEKDFNDLIIATDGDRSVRMRDVGYAILGPENEETGLKESGIPMIGLGIVPQPGTNYIEIADEFYKRAEQIKRDIPKGFKVDFALDNTRFIRRSVDEVKETLLIAISLVVLIIFLFFRDWIIAVRPLIDIPVSLVGAFFIMYVFNFSINILTLLAIVLATGLVVDDGIVVTENIYKKVEAGMSPMEAAFKGSAEIFFVVISTSITLAAVFLPIVFLQGFVGRLFREFGIVIAGAVLISAFVSLTLTPMLNAKLLRRKKGHTKFYEMTEPFFVSLIQNYSRSLATFMRRSWISVAVILGSVALIFIIGSFLPSELSPLEDRGMLRMSVTLPEGASYEYTNSYMDRLVQFVLDKVPEKKVLISITAPGFSGAGAVNNGYLRIVLSDAADRKRTQQQIANFITTNLRQFPEARTFVIQEQTIAVGLGSKGSLPVQFVLQAPNFEKLRDAVPKFMEAVGKNPTFQGFDINLKFNKPELRVTINRNLARSLGVSVQDVAETLRLAYSAQRFGYFIMNGKQYQVIGQMTRENRDQPLDLKSLFVKNKNGQLMQMDNLVNVIEDSSPPQLNHFNRYESATVSAGLAAGKTIGDGIEAMNKIAKEVLDESFTTALNGASRDYAESSSNILFAFLLALILIYLVLSAQFESFIDPFIIMLTVPLALAGALLSLWYFNKTLNIFSEIGIIMLIGLVTKNGIMLIEFTNQLREKGSSVVDAAQEAAALRFRPIVMTSLATVLGAMPIALAIGAGAQSRVAMGVAVIGGLLFSLVLTLYVIPTIYVLINKNSKSMPFISESTSQEKLENLEPIPNS